MFICEIIEELYVELLKMRGKFEIKFVVLKKNKI